MTGSGTLADPFVIENVNDLQAMKDNLTAYYELASNIDASATSGWNGGLGFNPIGTYVSKQPQLAFRGNFNGKGYKISNLFINRPLKQYVGLFGYTGLVGGYGGGSRDITNVGLENVNITGGDYSIAGLIGFQNHGRPITNCWITGYVTATGSRPVLVGGLVGYCDGVVSDCYFSGTVTINETAGWRSVQNGGLIGLLGGGLVGVTRCYSAGEFIFNGRPAGGSRCQETGGFVGLNTGAPISQCYSTMNITINNANHATEEIYAIGGFVGDNSDASITDCYARGNINAIGVQGTACNIGGFVGYNIAAITNCYSTGLITTNGTTFIGGFCGENYYNPPYCLGVITASFWDTQTSGQATSDGGTGKTTAQMKDKLTFSNVGWDFTTVWSMCLGVNDSYPCLLGVTPSCVSIEHPKRRPCGRLSLNRLA